jgi:hypothetical protein
MNHLVKLTALSVISLLVGCTAESIPTRAVEPMLPVRSYITNPIVSAFSPEKALIASYAIGGSNDEKPIAVLKGSQTQLSTGNGMAVDGDGTLYVVTQATDSHGAFTQLLVFAPGAHGNTAPIRTARLLGRLIPGYAVGLALDGHGNFWLSAIGRLLRYPTNATGAAKPNASIAVHLVTPDGLMPANSSNVALDSAGNIYAACAVVFQGAQASGISEYELEPTGKAKLIRSFYDLNLPEVPAGSIAIDGAGTIYLASSLPNTGVFAYVASTKSGNAHYTRRFTGPFGMMVISLTTDVRGNVYVAADSSRIMVFGPTANGHVRAIHSIHDPRHLKYTTNDYGTLLNIH